MNHLNWRYIIFAAAVPPLVGLIVAFPFWRKRRMTLGNIFAAAIIFATSIGLILREYAELDKITTECLDNGIPVLPGPERVHAVRDLRVHRAVAGHRALLAQPGGRGADPPPRVLTGVAIASSDELEFLRRVA